MATELRGEVLLTPQGWEWTVWRWDIPEQEGWSIIPSILVKRGHKATQPAAMDAAREAIRWERAKEKCDEYYG